MFAALGGQGAARGRDEEVGGGVGCGRPGGDMAETWLDRVSEKGLAVGG